MKEVLLDRKYYLLTWEDIEKATDILYSKIEKTFQPELIIGIMRGGIIVANLISDRLSVPRVYAIGVRHYEGINKRGSLEVYQPLPSSLELYEHNVLLVDEVSDTGKTFKNVIESQIKPRNPKEVRTASLYIKPWTGFVPDFFVYCADGWLIFPWDYYETMRHLRKELERKYSKEEIDVILRKKFGYNSML
jgi:hypoxanthine phosphoribosyltransferase